MTSHRADNADPRACVHGDATTATAARPRRNREGKSAGSSPEAQPDGHVNDEAGLGGADSPPDDVAQPRRTPQRNPNSAFDAQQTSVPILMWDSLDWHKTGQVCVIIIVVGITVALTLWGIGQIAPALIATPTAWSMIGGVFAGSSSGMVTYRITHRRRRTQGTERMPDQPER